MHNSITVGQIQYQKLPMICIEYVRAYIDNLISISNGNFEDHLNKIKIVLKKLKAAGFKIKAENHFLPEIV